MDRQQAPKVQKRIFTFLPGGVFHPGEQRLDLLVLVSQERDDVVITVDRAG
jgi:hypothetical protein